MSSISSRHCTFVCQLSTNLPVSAVTSFVISPPVKEGKSEWQPGAARHEASALTTGHPPEASHLPVPALGGSFRIEAMGAVTSRWTAGSFFFFKSSKEDEDSSPPHLRIAVDMEGVCCLLWGHMSDQRHSGAAPEPPVSPDCRLVDGKQGQQVGTRQSGDKTKRSFRLKIQDGGTH